MDGMPKDTVQAETTVCEYIGHEAMHSRATNTARREPEVGVSPHGSVQDGRSGVVHWVVFGPRRGPTDHVIGHREASNLLASYVELISCFKVEHAHRAAKGPDSQNLATGSPATLHCIPVPKFLVRWKWV